MKRAAQTAFANPVLIGAVTILITLVAVFLSYNANNGLPFVPTRQVKVDLADGADLVTGNDVREGGFRVGQVADLRPVQLKSGETAAEVTLDISKKFGPLPVDSVVAIRPLSVLGLKYLSITRGLSKKYLPDGATIPYTQTRVPVQFDDVFKTFDAPTRVASEENLQNVGDLVSGRGGDINDTISSLPPLLTHLEPVARYLSAPSTELTRFLTGLNSFMSAVSPVTSQAVGLFRDSATTFAAIDSSPSNLESTIAESPSTLSVSTTSLIHQQPFLVDLTNLGGKMAPGTAYLRQALPGPEGLNHALDVGTHVLVQTPVLDAKLQQLMNALKDLARSPGTNMALNALVSTVNILNPTVRYLGPYQTVCDSWDYWWTFLSEHLSERTQYGFAQRVLLNFGDPQQNSVSMQGATQPAGSDGAGPEFLHAQTYGSSIDNSGNADCESDQRGYPLKLNYFDPEGRKLATDPHTPGDQGPTYQSIRNGRYRVPAGETYTRNPDGPGAVPQLSYNPTNP